MAISYSNIPTPKPFSALLAIFVTFFILLASKVNLAQALSFDFPDFSGQTSITLQQDAKISSNGVLTLTNQGNLFGSKGRALYAKPVQLWDSATGNVASFVTSFSFVVENYQTHTPADGIVFFLAPEGTEIPPNSNGGNLGVVNSNTALNQFVGVEFDSYTNVEWDPDYPHIGIDVNSLLSLRTVKWNRVSGSVVKVSIIYDSLSQTLSVAVTNDDGGISTIAQVVDLKAVLPESIQMGFSATTTTGGREIHDIHSWAFTSTLATATSSTTEKMNIARYA